ncbi:MAG: TSUP family transporter [Pseudomonadota bacterium]
MLEHSHYLFPVLFFAALLGATIDGIAGGGGLITLPVLLFTGLPPQIALGTSKFQATFGTFMASAKYYQHGWFTFKTIKKGLIFGIAGAVLGAIAGQMLSSDLLRKILPILLFAMLLYMLFTPTLGHEDRKPRMSEFWFYIIFGFFLGFYDGFFGPATGSLWVFSLTFFLGYQFRSAVAYAKVFNFKSNVVALICFALGNNIDYRMGICMAAGQLIGGRFGAHLAILKGAEIIRPVFIGVTSLTIVALLCKSYL